MKRNFAIFLAVAMLMGCASCGWTGNANDNPVNYNQTTPANDVVDYNLTPANGADRID